MTDLKPQQTNIILQSKMTFFTRIITSNQLSNHLLPAKLAYERAMKKLQRRTPDLQATINQIKDAADAGYIPAQIKLAWSHIFGEGVALDLPRAKEIFERLAEKGIADAHSVSMPKLNSLYSIKSQGSL